MKLTYSAAIREAFHYLLKNYDDVLILGQGLWSPWYVGDSMKNLDVEFGRDRVLDSPVSESAVTGIAVGASIVGARAVVVHPRMDFMLYAMDPIVNQAAKWRFMFGGKSSAPVTIRSIINRGGEQGAQHSQSLHAWFCHVPGLRVVMPYSVKDARDLLIASVLSPDPVLYIDDRWLYELEEDLGEISETDLSQEFPKIIEKGESLTIVGSGFSTKLALDARVKLQELGYSAEIVDLRILNPFNPKSILSSVTKTRNLIVLDGGTKTSGFAAEVISAVMELMTPGSLQRPPKRITLPDSPAPTSHLQESIYYPSVDMIVKLIVEHMSVASQKE